MLPVGQNQENVKATIVGKNAFLFDGPAAM